MVFFNLDIIRIFFCFLIEDNWLNVVPQNFFFYEMLKNEVFYVFMESIQNSSI